MPAGREMDAHVFELVMGGRVTWNIRGIGGEEYLFSADGCHKYSTDISAAWEVVEKLGNWNGFDFLVWLNSQYLKREWQAGWYEIGYDIESRAVGYAPTVPLAICRAALLAVMEDK